MKKLLPFLSVLALPCCDVQPLPPEIPRGTDVIMKDGRSGWISSGRNFVDGTFKYTVKLPMWGGYQEITAGDFEFTVKPPTPEKQ